MEKPRKEPMLLNEWRQSPTAVCMIWTSPGNIILRILRVHTDLSPWSMVSPTLTARAQISKQITVSRTLSNLCLSLLIAPIPPPNSPPPPLCSPCSPCCFVLLELCQIAGGCRNIVSSRSTALRPRSAGPSTINSSSSSRDTR